MNPTARLLFGVRITEPTTLSIVPMSSLLTGPALRVTTAATDTDIPYSGGGWRTTLSVGDHILYLPAPSDRSLDVPLTFSFNTATLLVAAPNGAGGSLASWAVVSGASGDPKNPWPPPASTQLQTTSLTNPTWLTDALAVRSTEVSVDRSLV